MKKTVTYINIMKGDAINTPYINFGSLIFFNSFNSRKIKRACER